MPHHSLAGPYIAAGLAAMLGPAIDAAGAPAPIAVLGVDHALASPAPAATSRRAWQLPDGLVAVDGAMVAALIGGGAAGEAGPALAVEHSVAGVVPFVAVAAPGAPIVPLAVRPNAAPRAVAALADGLAGGADAPPIAVAAVDFAHGLSPEATIAHGHAAVAVLAARDAAAVARWDDAFADGRGALQLAIALAERHGATRWTTLAVADSRALSGWAGGGVSGYIVGCWGVDAGGGATAAPPPTDRRTAAPATAAPGR